MLSLIKAEFLKLKGMPYDKAIFVIGIILPFIGTLINGNSLKQNSWNSFINQNLWLAIMLVWPIYLLAVGSFMFICETKQRTIENLFVIPIGRIKLIMSKIIVLFLLTLALAIITYISNLFGLTLGFTIDLRGFFSGFFHYIISSVEMLGALLLVFAILHITKVGYFGAFIICSAFLVVTFVGMWNPCSASVLPLVASLRFSDCGYQITYAYPVKISLASYGFNVGISFVALLLMGYKAEQ
jgi:hypothetical protein